MDNTKNNQYYVDKILTDLKFVINHTQGKTQQQIEGDDLAYMETIEVVKKVIESNLFD